MAERVRDEKGIHRYLVDKCKICGVAVNLKVCAKCKQVAYCSKDHQIQDWPSHKGPCKKICKSTVAKTNDKSSELLMGDVTKSLGQLSIETQDELEVTSAKVKAEVGGSSAGDKHVDLPSSENTTSTMRSLFVNSSESNEERAVSTHGSSRVSDICRSKHKRQHSTDGVHDNNNTEIPRSDSANSISSNNSNTEFSDQELGSGSSERFILESEESTLHAPDYQKEQVNTANQDSKMPYLSVVESRNKALSEYVIKCLNAYGLCVIDNFLGDCKGTDILDEVQDMYESGDLASGQLVTANSPKGAVRGDVITWVDGSEVGCGNINFLISSIDAIMLHCQKSLGNYHIKGRSKAMVAVYPGNSTHFLRHVDNPSGDGRCVTCIYYLNKSWNSKVDGGLLRIFPEGANRVANVEPKFDRLLFFWSDRRNPHEVLPAYKTRFAVTVWYYDEQERRQAVKKFKGKSADAKVKEMVPLQGLSDKTY